MLAEGILSESGVSNSERIKRDKEFVVDDNVMSGDEAVAVHNVKQYPQLC